MSDLALRLIRENQAAHAQGEDATYLDLGRTGLTTLPDALFECTWLETLVVSNRYWDWQQRKWIESLNRSNHNLLKAIPAGMARLENLKTLYLSGDDRVIWQISDGRFLEKLPQLQSLDLTSNQISDGRFLEKLPQLQSLDLRNNQISDGRFLEKLPQLQSLDLSYNQISDGRFLEKLPQLQSLDLSHNKINNVLFLENLTKLQLLDVSFNQIRDWPLSLLESLPLEVDVEEYRVGSRKVSLYGNPIQNPPMEVLKQGREFAIEYLKSNNKRPLNECKVIIVGRGAVGKTSLQKRLFGEEAFNANEPETHGIRKRCWQGGVRSVNGQDPIKVNFWDFGGQHIQQALHQFFYSKNTLYILVLDKRKDENPEDFLELIRAYGHDSPVLVVYNQHIDLKNPQPPTYNPSPELDSSLRRKYPNIRRVFGVCCGIENDEGVAALRQYLQKEIPTYQHVREPYPVSWLDIKDQLLNKVKHNYILYDAYQKICQAKQLREIDIQKGLVGMLDDAGTITYFDRPFSGKYYILNPDWLTAGAYALILSPLTRDKRGRINAKEVQAILDEVDTFQYTSTDRGFLLDLMNEFDLCHEYSRHEWLIPSALEGQSKTDLVQFTQQNHRQYALSYPISLPRSVIHRFIARNVKYAPTEDYWRNGIVVKHPDSQTLMYVEADEKDREIRLYISGERIRDCWEFFRKDLKEFSEKFIYEEMVKYGEGKISYNHLIRLYNRGMQTWYSPDLDQDIDVREVLGLFESSQKIEDALPIKPKPSPLPKTDNQIPEIFFSYAWGDEKEQGESREDIVVRLYKSLKTDGFAVRRDKVDLGYKGLISEFMAAIGKGDFIVVVLSEKYLKSEYCMFELYEIFRNSKLEVSGFVDKIYPIRVENLDLSPKKIIEYHNHWANKQNEWKELVKIDSGYGTEAERIDTICAHLAKLIKIIRDINTLTKNILSQDNFAEIKRTIEAKTKE